MDQDTLVTEQKESAERLIEELHAVGFEVSVAFWAKPTDDGKWFLYLASQFVNEKGLKAAYLRVHEILRSVPDLFRIEPLDVKLVRLDDSLTKEALAATKPRVPDSKFAVQNPKRPSIWTWFGKSTLAGMSIDGAWIYQSSRPVVSV